MTKNRDIRIVIVVAFLLFTVSLVSGATITVDDSGGADYLSIQTTTTQS